MNCIDTLTSIQNEIELFRKKNKFIVPDESFLKGMEKCPDGGVLSIEWTGNIVCSKCGHIFDAARVIRAKPEQVNE